MNKNVLPKLAIRTAEEVTFWGLTAAYMVLGKGVEVDISETAEPSADALVDLLNPSTQILGREQVDMTLANTQIISVREGPGDLGYEVLNQDHQDSDDPIPLLV